MLAVNKRDRMGRALLVPGPSFLSPFIPSQPTDALSFNSVRSNRFLLWALTMVDVLELQGFRSQEFGLRGLESQEFGLQQFEVAGRFKVRYLYNLGR